MTSGDKNLLPVRRKLSMQEASAELAALDHRLQAGEDPTSALNELFNQYRVELAEGIDRRKGCAWYLSMLLSEVKGQKNALSEWEETLKQSLETLKSKTVKDMRAHLALMPDYKFRDSVGRKVWIQRSTPALKVKLNLREAKSVRNILDHDEVQFRGIPGKYIKQVSYMCLDSEAVKADLKAGVKLDWAEITQGQHLGGFLPKAEKANEETDDE